MNEDNMIKLREHLLGGGVMVGSRQVDIKFDMALWFDATIPAGITPEGTIPEGVCGLTACLGGTARMIELAEEGVPFEEIVRMLNDWTDTPDEGSRSDTFLAAAWLGLPMMALHQTAGALPPLFLKEYWPQHYRYLLSRMRNSGIDFKDAEKIVAVMLITEMITNEVVTDELDWELWNDFTTLKLAEAKAYSYVYPDQPYEDPDDEDDEEEFFCDED